MMRVVVCKQLPLFLIFHIVENKIGVHFYANVLSFLRILLMFQDKVFPTRLLFLLLLKYSTNLFGFVIVYLHSTTLPMSCCSLVLVVQLLLVVHRLFPLILWHVASLFHMLFVVQKIGQIVLHM